MSKYFTKATLRVALIVAVILLAAVTLSLVGVSLAGNKSSEQPASGDVAANQNGAIPASSRPSQWCLSDLVGEGSLHIMFQSQSEQPGALVSVPSASAYIWRADTATFMPAPFGTTTWKIKLLLGENPPKNEDFFVYLGYIDSLGVFHSIATGTLSEVTDNKTWWFEATPEDPFTVPTGDYLALKIDNATSKVLKLQTGQSWIEPNSEPVYPAPELDTILLFAAGLSLLAGWVVVRRWGRRWAVRLIRK